MSDICFIVAPQNNDTILDRIAHEIGSRFESPIYHYRVDSLPKSDRYFVTHYSMLPPIIAQVNPQLTPVISFFTHDKGSLFQFINFFNLCQSVIAESPEGMTLLAKLGVNQDKLHFVPEGGDSNRFTPHIRTDDGAILVCGTNYADGRKNHELIRRVMFDIPGREFMFIGKNWPIDREEIPYEDYPKYFSECSVYLSCSKLEGGGPNSLIEAMHANLVPVVSDTGNARQYIVDGYNGFIFPVDSSPDLIVSLIEKAYKLQPQNSLPYADIWQTVKNMTWKEYSLNMHEIIMDDYSITSSQNLDLFEEGMN